MQSPGTAESGLAQTKGNAHTVQICGQHDDLHLLMEFEYLGRVLKFFYAHLRDMDKAILFDSYIHKGTESSNVRHYARKFHSGNKIVNGLYVMTELKFGCSLARIETRLAPVSYTHLTLPTKA